MSCSDFGGRRNCRCECECKCERERERVDPCAEEKRRCYCEGFRDGCNDPCCQKQHHHHHHHDGDC